MIQTIIIFIAVAVFVALISVTVACYQVTRTFDVFHFVCDYRYWCFAILNFRYGKAISSGMDTHAFIKQFTKDFIIRKNLKRILPMKETERILFVCMLSNVEFIEKYFGMDKFGVVEYKSLWEKWIQYSRDNGIKGQEDAQ